MLMDVSMNYTKVSDWYNNWLDIQSKYTNIKRAANKYSDDLIAVDKMLSKMCSADYAWEPDLPWIDLDCFFNTADVCSIDIHADFKFYALNGDVAYRHQYVDYVSCIPLNTDKGLLGYVTLDKYSSNDDLSYKLYYLVREAKNRIKSKLKQAKKLLRHAASKLKSYVFVRDIRKTITRVILKHYKSLSDVSGSDINVFSTPLNAIYHVYNFFKNDTRQQSGFYKYTDSYYQQPG